MTNSKKHILGELASIFLKLGATSFGGPAAHIARMQDEFVDRRGWIERERFLDLMSLVSLIPGPNSTQLAIEIGFERGGWAGLTVAGICFISPAMLMVLVLAHLYVMYGALPQTEAVLAGLGPVVIAIVAQALGRFARAAIKGIYGGCVAAISLGLLLAGCRVTTVLGLAAICGIVYGVLAVRRDAHKSGHGVVMPLHAAAPASLWKLFALFLKIGCIVYGSGYVLLAFLREDLVLRLHWLTDKQLVDAVAIGQVTPGPVFTTATFVGYVVGAQHHLGALPAALIATLGIFLPSFAMVGLLTLLIRRWKDSPVLRKFLDTVNATSFSLMALVTAQLAGHVFLGVSGLNWVAVIVGVGALVVLCTTKVNAAWLLGAGAGVGWLMGLR